MPGAIRVAVDAHTVGRRATGNETYVRGLLDGLSTLEGVETVALVDRPADAAGREGPPGLRAELRFRNPIARLLADLPSVGSRLGVQLLHVQYVRPPRCDVPCVTTIHDISFEHFPRLFTARALLRMKATIPWSARHSAAVLTGSEHSRRDLVRTYRLSAERVHVTPYAADGRFRPIPRQQAVREVAAIGLPSEYLLCVGNLQPRKNLRRLLDAYAGLDASLRLPLVVVGQRGWLDTDVFQSVRKHRLTDSVHFTGFVPMDRLVTIYRGATAFVYLSLYEGFGLPVLEALACGVPSLVSNSTSLPEVAGDAALLVDPHDREAIREGLIRLLSDEDLRRRLADAGPRQAARFSWRQCAMATAQVYRSVVGQAGG